ncbi:hypothetical protein F0562_027861 [Nyssa sinensis]|uniref:Reverse transcriptase RNase H-like domain-containing protein n=1 Tax=Nyssa sinensis TaxID=561372 RepID=A0A5J5B7H9_9ASTE|nr:hypothetical protein F0562_027861 [Nyssa sinensis]
MTTTPTLAMPNFQEVFTIETDASGDGIEVVLTQQGKPVAYMSRALKVTKKCWLTYAKEMLAIIAAIRMWRPYLLGQKFYIKTDQRSLKYLLEQRMATPEQQKWVVKLLGYDYEILYHPGRENSAADALLRKPGSSILYQIFLPQISLWEDIKEAAKEDPYIQSMGRVALEQPGGSYTWRHGLLLYKGKVIVPGNAALKAKLLHEMHDTKALYGRLPPSIPTYNDRLSLVHEVDQQLLNRDELLRHLKANLERSVNRMKQLADHKRRDISFKLGDWVLLKLHPYRQQTAFKRVYQKLASRFYGPYQILAKVGLVAYQLQLPEGARIHPVFHVSLLKQYQAKEGSAAPPPVELPPFTDDGVIHLEPHTILNTRWVKQGAQLIEESLVHWKHLPAEDATWEPTQKLLAMFPGVDLEDKDPPNGGGVLIYHDVQSGASSQILNIWDELNVRAVDVDGVVST